MSNKPILLFDHDKKGILSKRATPVSHGENCRALVEYMFEAMNYPKGIGLAAPQIGENKRIIVVRVPNMRAGRMVGGSQKHAIINPTITWHAGEKVVDAEGCLSFPGEVVPVARYPRVKVTGFDLRWETITIGGKGLLARALQHEIDHLNGITLDTYARQSLTGADS